MAIQSSAKKPHKKTQPTKPMKQNPYFPERFENLSLNDLFGFIFIKKIVRM